MPQDDELLGAVAGSVTCGVQTSGSSEGAANLNSMACFFMPLEQEHYMITMSLLKQIHTPTPLHSITN
eukprot:3888710-Amphidinium_carterae.2